MIQVGPGENDTVKVLDVLGSACTPTAILNVLRMIHGPWSFIFWQVNIQLDIFSHRSYGVLYRHLVKAYGLVEMWSVDVVFSGTYHD